jgi:hypothetical protein
MAAHEQMTLPAPKEKRGTLADAIAWRDKNPDAYDQVVEWAHIDAAVQGYCSMDAYAVALRSPAIARRLGLRRSDAVYRFNNNLKAPMQRLILRDYPRLPFRTRASGADE